MHRIVGQVGDHGAGRAIGASRDHHAQADQYQLGGSGRQGECQGQQQATAQAVADGKADLAVRATASQTVAEHAAENDPYTTAQHDDGGYGAGFVSAHGVVAIQIARYPHDHGTADEQLQATADVGADHRAAGIQGTQRAPGLECRLAGLIDLAPGRDASLFDDERVKDGQ
ncbi:hypothetical protein D9M71_389560 [compost metagenome]